MTLVLPLDCISRVGDGRVVFIALLLSMGEDGADKDLHLASQVQCDTNKDDEESEEKKCDRNSRRD